jgi:hypothetical protein
MGGEIELIPVAVLFSRKFSLFRRCKAPAPCETLTFRDFLARTKTGFWRKLIEAVREAAMDSEEDAKAAKEKLPAIKPSGTFSGLRQEHLLVHSGLLAMDFDGVGESLPALREKLKDDPFVLAIVLSPRGKGLKVFVAVAAATADEHKRCFGAAYQHFLPMVPAGGVLDPRPSNVVSNCFVSWDPDLWVATTPRRVFAPGPDLPTGTREKGEKKVISEGSGASTASAVSAVSTSHPSPTARQRRAEAEKRRLALPPPLGGKDGIGGLFERYIGRRLVLRGSRDEWLTKVIPATYPVVSAPVLLDLLLLHYDLHSGVWSTPRDEHEAAIRSSLADWPAKYASRLSERERVVYATLGDEFERATFRICRGLWEARDGDTFFLSYCGLGVRIGRHPEQARRIMLGFYADGILEHVTSGEARGGGRPATATTWRWLLPTSSGSGDPVRHPDSVAGGSGSTVSGHEQ